jgi:hypothetical protein
LDAAPEPADGVQFHANLARFRFARNRVRELSWSLEW